MRILVLAGTGVRLPLDGVSRPLHELLSGLVVRGHEVTLLTARRSEVPTPGVEYSVMEPAGLPIPHRGAAISTRHTFGRGRRGELGRSISAARPDVVISYLVHGMYLVPSDVPVVLIAQDVLSELLAAQLDLPVSFRRRVGLEFSRRQMRVVERSAFRRADHVTVVSEHEADLVRGLHGVEAQVVPNGVGLPSDRTSRVEGRDRPAVLFVGNLGAPKNAAAAMRLCSRIAPRLSGVDVTIAGARPSVSLVESARAAGVQLLADQADLRPAYRAADIFVACHETGTGIKNCVLEAMAAEVPVVSTSAASLGLGSAGRRTITVADSDDQIVDSVKDLLANPDHARRLASAARQYVARHHTWAAYVDRIIVLCESALENRATSP